MKVKVNVPRTRIDFAYGGIPSKTGGGIPSETYSGTPSDTYGGIPSVKVKVAAPASPTRCEREMCAQTVESHPNVGVGGGHAACTAH